MKKEFEEYNKKYFRNIQFIYDFLDKIGMEKSLEELKNESKINYIKDYDSYFLDNTNYDSDNNINNNENDDLSDDFDINYTFLNQCIKNMNNSILCKAIDNFENILKIEIEKKNQEDEIDKKDFGNENFYINNNNFVRKKEHIYPYEDTEEKRDKQSCNKEDLESEYMNIKNYNRKEDKSEIMIDNEVEEIYYVKKNENLKATFPKFMNNQFNETKENFINDKHLGKDESSFYIHSFKNENEMNVDNYNGKLKNDDLKYSQNEYNDNIKEKCISDNMNYWDNYFSCEREICKELKVKYNNNSINKEKNDKSYSETSNILTVKYIDIYNTYTEKDRKNENIIFFKKFLPILLLVGYSDNRVKLFMVLYEKKNDNENNIEECIHMNKELDNILLSSPVMYIDINYKDNLVIVSSMNGEIYLCKINMNCIINLANIVELNNSVDDIVKNIKRDVKYISIIKNFKYHNKYSIKCKFNEDYSLFCSISNDKNLIIYEKIIDDNMSSVFYEKKKIIGLPEIPTSFLWIKENNGKESIIVSMLNSNNIIFLNSKNYNIENKVYLFDIGEKYNILNLAYNKKKNILVVCTDTSKILVYSFMKKSIIKKIYGCVLNSLSFPTIELDINGNNIYVTSDDKINGTYILIFDIKSGNIINNINNGYKIRCFQLLKKFICPFYNKINSNDIEENKKSLLVLGSFDKKIHFYSN
ncbi:conserved Plasmodium protein, unknown function [Plasmodium gallinaceum]|uniref:LisH domain-containing protein n=1 Tax=Plasmodium gallinaceum TaxID=5849 RepID=A0A1J1GZ69_PLAGA|nr:conserved Plasmodium protein, unknown function [Plasmodium gallinaceum]CRG97757.1 conserved Plasmodium protein, unknown function [Plasmodium gallinaceum]